MLMLFNHTLNIISDAFLHAQAAAGEIAVIVNRTVVDSCPRRRTVPVLGSAAQLSDQQIKPLPLPGHATLVRSLSTWLRTTFAGSGKDPHLFRWD